MIALARQILATIGISFTFPGVALSAIAPDSFLHGVNTILFLGDSLTDGSSYPDYVVNTLNRIHPEADFRLINAGIAGDTATDLRQRLPDDVLALKPDLVVIAIGTNDAVGNIDPATYRENLSFIIRAIQAQGGKVLLVRPSPILQPSRAAKLQSLLAILEELSKEYQCPVADVYGLFLEWQAAGREVMGEDGIHHGPDGFECKARAIVNALGYPDEPLDTTVRSWPGLLLDWETSDSFPLSKEGEYHLSQAVGWKPFDRAGLAKRLPWSDAPFTLRGAWMPFEGRKPKEVAFGRTTFIAPHAGEWRIEVGGSQKPLIVWINGAEAWRSHRVHGYHPNADRFTATLHKGENEIVVISNYMTFLGVYPIADEGDSGW